MTANAPDGSRLLDDVSFSVERGWLVAVAGPTGAGKTSLVRALIGSLALTSGKIRLDGEDLDSESHALRRRVGYVPQDDLLHHQLGLRRTMEYAASLRLPGTTSASQRSTRVMAVLAELGLERQAKLAVGSLSGGQRKRANLAVELLAEPDVLVLDEPTSGLDPGHEKSVMTTLREIADRGRTVIAVTHSMGALALCDRVIFLAAGGQLAFFGTPEEAAIYFAITDPAEVFAALNARHASWKERWTARPVLTQPATDALPASAAPAPAWGGFVPRGSAPVSPGASSVVPGWAAQLLTLMQRYLDLIKSDRRHVAMLALQGPFIGLLLWAVLARKGLSPLPFGTVLDVVSPRTVSVAAFLAISITWLGTASAVREIVKEHSILKREKGAGLSLNAYVTSKMMVLGTIIMIQAVLFTAIACIRQSPPSHGAVFGWGLGELMVTTALVGLAAVALGLLLSALVSTPDKAMTVLPVALVAQLILSGAWGSLTRVPGIAQLSDLTGAHWGLKAIEATVTGNSNAWWSAIITLVCLTAGTLVITTFLVQRRLHPEWALARRRTSHASGLASCRRALLAPVVAVSMILVLTGTAEVGFHLTRLSGARPIGIVSARPTVAPSAPAAKPSHTGLVSPTTKPTTKVTPTRAKTATTPPTAFIPQSGTVTQADTITAPVTTPTAPTRPVTTPSATNPTTAPITPPTISTPTTTATPSTGASPATTTPTTTTPTTTTPSTTTPTTTTPTTTTPTTATPTTATPASQAGSSLGALILAWERASAAAQGAGYGGGGTFGSGHGGAAG